MYRDDGADHARSSHVEARPAARPYSRPPAKPRDPFFDMPYEPAAVQESAPPSWEASGRPAARSISANIKPKRKVAALFRSEKASA